MAMRRRRGFRRLRGRPAGPFANSERGGRQLQWYGLNVASFAIAAPAVTFLAAGINYNVFQLAPAPASLKGIATVERIRGWMAVYHDTTVSCRPVWQSIQVIRLGAGDAAVANADTVTTFDQLRLDSINIMHSAMYWPVATTDGAVQRSHNVNLRDEGSPLGNVDVRVRRRIDFSQFWLAHVIAWDDVAPDPQVGLHLRGLFRTMGQT